MNATTTHPVTTAQHESAIEWMACAFPGQATDDLTPEQCRSLLEIHYDGGWVQFVTDLGGDTWAATEGRPVADWTHHVRNCNECRTATRGERRCDTGRTLHRLADQAIRGPQPCCWCDELTTRWDQGNPDCGCF